MSDSYKKIAGDSFYLYLTQGLNYILPFLILPYLLKTLSTSSFGIFIYSQAIMQIMMLFVDFGFNISGTKEISINANKQNKVSQIYWSINLIKLIFAGFIFLIVAVFFKLYTPLNQYSEGVIAAGLSVFGSVFFPMWLFQGLGKMKIMAIIGSVSKIIFLPLIFVFVTQKDDYMIAIYLHTLVQLSMGIIATVYVLKDRNLRNIKKSYFKYRKITYYIKDSFPIFLSNSSITLYTSGITFILGFFVDSRSIGIYGAIDRIVRVICFGVYGPLSQAAFPILVKVKLESFVKAQKMLKMIFGGILVLMIFIFVILSFSSDYLIGLFYPELLNYKILLIISLFSIIPISLGGVSGQLGLIALGGNAEKKIFSSVYIIVGLSSLVISYFCIRIWNIEGAIYSVVASEILVFLLMFYFVTNRKILC